MSFDLARLFELIACCTRSAGIVRDLLAKPEEIQADYDPLLAMFLRVLGTQLDIFDELPSLEHLKIGLQSQIDEEEDSQIKAAVVGAAKRVFICVEDLKKKTDAQVDKIGRELMAQYLKKIRLDQLKQELAEEESEKDGAQVIEKAMQDLSSIAASRANVFADEWNLTQEDLESDYTSFEPTYIDFIDTFCDGGIASGEVVGHSAPIGQGKTTLVLQICWSRIMGLLAKENLSSMENLQSIDWSRFPIVYGFFFEKVINLVPSVVSNAALIPRDRAINYYIKTRRDPLTLSSKQRQDWQPYERKLFAEQFRRWAAGDGPAPDGELERAQRVQFIASKLFRMADFSGASQEVLEWAEAGVRGMRNYIDAHQNFLGGPGIDFICCDYVGALADVWKRSSDRMIRNMSRTELLKTIVTSLGIDLASPLNCPVWAAHQLNSIENKRAGGFIPDPTNNEGTGMFLERCAVGIASGKLTSEGVAVFVNAKQRRSAERQPIIVQLSKQFARWDGINRRYAIIDNQIVDKDTEVSTARGRSKRFRVPPSVGPATEDARPW